MRKEKEKRGNREGRNKWEEIERRRRKKGEEGRGGISGRWRTGRCGGEKDKKGVVEERGRKRWRRWGRGVGGEGRKRWRRWGRGVGGEGRKRWRRWGRGRREKRGEWVCVCILLSCCNI